MNGKIKNALEAAEWALQISRNTVGRDASETSKEYCQNEIQAALETIKDVLYGEQI